MRRIMQSMAFAVLIVSIIPLRAFSNPTLTAQRPSSQIKETRQNSIQKDAAPQATPKTSGATLMRNQDSQLLPPVDPEFGLKATFGKCSAVEVIGPDGTCIPAPIPSSSSQP